MNTVDIDYYDGKTSQVRPARIWLDDTGVLHLSVEGEAFFYALCDVDVSSRLGNTARRLSFPGGASAETFDNDGVDRLLAPHQPRRRGWLHRLESRYSLVAAALLLTVLLTAGFISHGVPWLADKVARALPAGFDSAVGSQTLVALDEVLFEPSRLDAEVQADYRRRFARLLEPPPTGHDYQLLFRHSPVIGANALALPDGTIIMTDELVELAATPDEVTAVLAHEIGHVVGRHGMRRALQSSLVVLVVAAVTGDVGSAGGLASVLPVVLVEAGYSRDLEQQADLFARDLMLRQHIPLDAFARIMRRLAASAGDDDGDGHGQAGFLDTHPAPDERAALFESPAM